MARFVGLRPLILVLCIALCGIFGNPSNSSMQTGPSPNTSTVSSDKSQEDKQINGTGKDSTPHNSLTIPALSNGGVSFENNIKTEADISTSNSPSLTSQQHPTGSTAGPKPTRTPPQISQSTELIQTEAGKLTSPSLTSQQHPTGPTAGPLPTRTPPQISQSSETVGSSVAYKKQTDQTTLPPLTSHQHSTGAKNITTILAGTSPSSIATVSPTPSNTPTGIKPECSKINITVTPSNDSATHVNISNVPLNYTVEIIETSKGISVNNAAAVKGNIRFDLLKPCTNYTIRVNSCTVKSFILQGGVEKTIFTSETSWNDTHVCYTVKNWTFQNCVKINNSQGCENGSEVIKFNKCSYTVVFNMPPDKLNLTFENKIPSQFNWNNKPEQCVDTFNVTCTHNTREHFNSTFQLNQSVSFLPNKTYFCTGKYTYKNKLMMSNELPINIQCDWQKNNTGMFSSIQNKFFIMKFNLKEKTCPGIELHTYSASCNNKITGCCTQNGVNGTECSFKDLEPYTSYTCEIKAKISTSDTNLTDEYIISTGRQQTDSAEPSFTENQAGIKIHNPQHNSVEVICNNIAEKEWNGGKGRYQAILEYNGHEISQNQSACFFLFENLYYLTTYKLKVTATNLERKSTTITSTASTKYNDKAVTGFLVFLIIMTILLLFFVLYKIFPLKGKRNDEDQISPPQQPLNIEPILAENLLETYKRKIADESRLFMDEFQSIPRIFSNYTIKEAKKTENQSKNRYVDILPYDYNRVTLSTNGNNDYINASFIEGYKEPRKYIAAQGPKDETIEDFWRMIWEQKSAIIVMVTRCEEGTRSKCAQYWPHLERQTEIYEDFVVKIKSEERFPDYIIRHLLLNNKTEKATEREVTHIQFISWPDHGVPEDPTLLLKLRRRVNSFKNFFSGPIVVHCSAGVGRTGTYMSIDAMIQSLEAEGKVDIYGYVTKLRHQRCLMVQVETQYILIHMALIEHHLFGETEILLSELHSELKALQQKDENNPSLLELEFQKLPKFNKWRTFNTATSDENKTKNRHSIVPYDYNRVCFRLDLDGNQTSNPEDDDNEDEEEPNEYINASFINGYWCCKSLIAAQGPLPDTTADFLLMLYQQQAKTLVMLTDCKEDDKEFCDQYWGDEKKVFGEMEIQVKKTDSFTTYVRRRLEIRPAKKKEVLEVDQYQFLKWRSSELPETPQELVEMMRNIKESEGYDNSKMNRNVPIVVHCNDGSSRTGIFCALWNLMDSASTEKLVDVFQVVKNLRKERTGIIQTYEQYQFLYTALEGAFPVQNGAVKSPASDSLQFINETTALLSEPACGTSADQQEAEASNTVETSV